MVGFLSGDDGSVGGKHKVNTGVGHKVGLELGDIDVEGSVESEGGSKGRDDLSNQAVEVGVGGALNVEVAAADIVARVKIKRYDGGGLSDNYHTN